MAFTQFIFDLIEVSFCFVFKPYFNSILLLAIHIYIWIYTHTTNLNRIYCITNEEEITKEINTYIRKLNI